MTRSYRCAKVALSYLEDPKRGFNSQYHLPRTS